MYGYVSNRPLGLTDWLGLSGYFSIVTSTVYGGGSSATAQEFATGRHAWVELNSDSGDVTSWGTFRGSGLLENMERDNPERYDPTDRRPRYIDDDAEARVRLVLDEYNKLGEKAWGWTHPCTTLAKEAWRAATGEDLSDGPLNTPRSLANSIRNANNADLVPLRPVKAPLQQ